MNRRRQKKLKRKRMERRVTRGERVRKRCEKRKRRD
jgi:hypothetical protein